jgi:hypothetical protein
MSRQCFIVALPPFFYYFSLQESEGLPERFASRRVSGHGLLKWKHFKKSEPESRVEISSQGKLTRS